MEDVVPKGFQFAGVRCGLKNKRNDLGLAVSDRPAQAAGVFTQNSVRAACVDATREVMAGGFVRALVVNSGNANCCTGEQGRRDTIRMQQLAATALQLDREPIAVASTGVIGQLMDMAKVERGVFHAAGQLGTDVRPLMDAILTTDLVEKQASTRVGEATILGIAKGSGMIAPNMATMLAFVFTDADVSALDLDRIWRDVCDATFNRVTVDSDTSTNDMALVLANGASGFAPDEAEFAAGLRQVVDDLARQIARDGEGATKLLEVTVTGHPEAERIARSIADSPLVKTAMFGCDPNWGRILMAAGKTQARFSPEDVRLQVVAQDEAHVLFESGTPAPFDPKKVSTALKSDHVRIELAIGDAAEPTATVYTCDLGYGYVRINAEYHT
ncbi:MAG: bifunctional glutamate N-acetyltransferase/amino-acid acetyltransferase ArgJ [Fimbriimonadaceae bacterium]|nr:bifunctional glutamate N-acetyltransferase/amino-acid acetyltransferase ArgJ [Fimbriimonadaceae bacterium]